jgi:dipeptidyl aminopeptidase/acylaminoacyl peptidase
VTFDAAYGKERIIAHLFLPRNARPPYQTIVFAPPGEAIFASSSDNLRMRFQEIVLRSGRALLHPVYKGTYERRLAQRPRGPAELRDVLIQIAKDLRRSVDYLETRPDVDSNRLGYWGISMGAGWGPWLLGVDDRFQAAVLQGGGFRFWKPLPEVDPFHFAPRVRTPVLMLNGRHDFEVPLDASQKPLFKLLGTPEKDKRHVLFEAGHADYPVNELIKELLDWFDRYLGPVEGRRG